MRSEEKWGEVRGVMSGEERSGGGVRRIRDGGETGRSGERGQVRREEK